MFSNVWLASLFCRQAITVCNAELPEAPHAILLANMEIASSATQNAKSISVLDAVI
jgi:hypothetical protein